MAEIINFQAERLRRGKDHVSKVFQNLAAGSDMAGVPDEQLVQWAHELANTTDDKTLEQAVSNIEQALAAVKEAVDG